MDSLHSNVHFSARLIPEPRLPRGKKRSCTWKASKEKIQITDNFLDGIFFGIKAGSEEFVIGTPAGCVVCGTVQRRPREDAAEGPSRDHTEQCGARLIKAMSSDAALGVRIRDAYERMSRQPSCAESDMKKVRFAEPTTEHAPPAVSTSPASCISCHARLIVIIISTITTTSRCFATNTLAQRN